MLKQYKIIVFITVIFGFFFLLFKIEQKISVFYDIKPQPTKSSSPGIFTKSSVIPKISSARKSKTLDLQHLCSFQFLYPESHITSNQPLSSYFTGFEDPKGKQNRQKFKTSNYDLSNPDTEKFILGIYPYGPNNQIMSFFETLQIAKVLNRTMIMTTMFRHQYDPQIYHDPFINPWLRLNFQEIQKSFPEIKFVSADEGLARCNFKFDPIYFKLKKSKSRYSFFQDYYQMSLGGYRPNLQLKKEKLLTFDNNSEILDYFSNNLPSGQTYDYQAGKCLFLMFPFRSVKKLDLTYDALKFPSYIQNLTSKIKQHWFNSVQGKIDLAIHWRYNNFDWGNRCNQTLHRIAGTNQKQCQVIWKFTNENVTSEYLADLILKWDANHDNHLSDFPENSTQNPPKNRSVYIAAPPSEYKFIQKVSFLLSKKSPGIKVFTLKDLLQFVQHKLLAHQYTSCQIFQQYADEIYSLLEQSLISDADYFYFWPLSTWSDRIIYLREEYYKKFGVRQENLDIIEQLQDVVF